MNWLDPPLTPANPVALEATAVVLHATETQTLAQAVQILRERGLGYHYLIDRDGEIYCAVPPSLRAHHAGESLGPDGEAANRYSLGVSFVNLNDGEDPYPEAQAAAAAALLLQLASEIPGLKWLTTHAAIAPGRKVDPQGFDPGPLAARTGLTLWP